MYVKTATRIISTETRSALKTDPFIGIQNATNLSNHQLNLTDMFYSIEVEPGEDFCIHQYPK